VPVATDAELRRREILDQAFSLFAERGYHALGMRDLARALGATTGVLYHWFPDKPALFEAMLERQVGRQVQEAVAAVGGVEKGRRLRALARFLSERVDDMERTLRVALDYQRQHAEGRVRLQGMLGLYRDALVHHHGLGSRQANRFVSAVLGILVHHVLDPDGADAVAQLRELGAG
jgi:AcrR family transcriptional regulator